MGQLVSLTEWARGPNGFRPAPGEAALRQIAKTKQTNPPAQKQGRRWVIDEDAKFVGIIDRISIPDNLSGAAKSLVEKTINGRKTA
ncbi:hypothetical protein RI820_000453 [Pluralibacter gergoviae]|nr:hypothetical protein [Pluralibacter gergoviae]ELC3015616.1 hypothetical protein [Pluralibacter gergoviae]ELC3020595.1 hypothetical protein [Pluralibacter gergoviae]